MSLPSEAPIEIGPDDARAVVFLLHGFGADAWDLAGLVPELDLPHIRYVLPDAPLVRATLAGGQLVRAWYDIRTLEPSPHREDASGVRASSSRISALMAEQAARGVPPERMVLAGFSQGGAMALYVGLRHPSALAGLAGMSSYLVLPDTLAAEAHPANAATPVWLAHGTQDDVVPFSRGQAARAALEGAERSVQWSTWPIRHEICGPELASLRTFLLDALPASLCRE